MAQAEFTQSAEDGFSQFFIEPAPAKPETDCSISPDAQEVLGNLLNAYRRLRAASYRIGQLEGRLIKYRRLSRTLISQATHTRTARGSEQPSQQTNRDMTADSRCFSGEFDQFDENDIPWWQALSEALVGSDRPRGSGFYRGKFNSHNSYYELIRQSLDR